MASRAPALWALTGALAALTLGACSNTIDGTGGPASTAGTSAGPDFPTGSSSATTPPTSGSRAAPTPTTPTTTPAPKVPSVEQRSHALEQQVDGARVLVRVSGGYEAATYDQDGHIAFWRNPLASTAWKQVGLSAYPVVPDIGPPRATAQGRQLSGMRHATFIVHGIFTGDSSGNAVAFTTGSKGWGAIKAEPSGRIGSSGRPIGKDQVGLSYDFAFRGGRLETKDCSLSRPISDCDTHPVTKLWQWNGSDFSQV